MSIIISSGNMFQTPMDLRAFRPLKMYWLPRGLRPRGCRGIESGVNSVRSVVLSHSELWRRGSPSGSKRDGIAGSVWLWERMKEKGKKLQAIDTSEQTSRGIIDPSTYRGQLEGWSLMAYRIQGWAGRVRNRTMVLALVGLERFRAHGSAGQRRADEAVVRANLGERENRVRNEWVAREAESSLEPHGGTHT